MSIILIIFQQREFVGYFLACLYRIYNGLVKKMSGPNPEIMHIGPEEST